MLPAMEEERDPTHPAAQVRRARREELSLVAPVVVPRWVQLVLLPLSVLALYVVARAAGTVLLVFLIAAVIALILNPIVSFVQRGRMPRSLTVIAVYLAFFTTLVGAGFLLSGPVADQARSFQRDVPDLVDRANEGLHDVQVFLDDNGIDVEVERQGETALTTLQSRVLEGSGEVVSVTGEILARVVETGFHILLVVVLSIYMLIYAPTIGALVRKVMPPGDGTPGDDFPTLAQRAVYGYVRGQLLFSLIMGASAGLMLWAYGAAGIFEEGGRYALAFGAWFGLMELVPYIGPVLGAAAPILVAAFEDPLTAVWVGLGFLALQQLEGHVVAPQVFGRALRLNPLLVLFALLLGGEVAGFVGAIVALPIAAVVRETVVYLRRHLVLEPWGREPLTLDGPSAAPEERERVGP
jgi:predicted PurR-regulated permease PerM